MTYTEDLAAFLAACDRIPRTNPHVESADEPAPTTQTPRDPDHQADRYYARKDVA